MNTIEGKTHHRETTAELAAVVDDRHARIEDKVKNVVILAKEAGDVLVTLKRRVRGDGEKWMDWVAANLEPSYDSVVRYMRIALRWKRLEPAVRDNPRMTLDEAVNIIIDKKRPIKRQPKPCSVDRELLRSTFGILLSEINDDDVAWLAEPFEDATSRLDAILQQALHGRARSTDDPVPFRTDDAFDAVSPTACRPATFDAELLRYPLQARTRLGLDGEGYATAAPSEDGGEANSSFV